MLALVRLRAVHDDKVTSGGSTRLQGTSPFTIKTRVITPAHLTIARAGASGLGSPLAMHNAMRQVALSLLVIVCTSRAVVVLSSASFRSGLTDLLIAFIDGVAGIQGAWWFCALFVRAGTLITQAVLRHRKGIWDPNAVILLLARSEAVTMRFLPFSHSTPVV